VHFVGLAFVAAEQLDRQIDHRMLAAIRIKVYHHKNDVISRRRGFAVKQNRVIIGMVEVQVVVKLQGAIFAANSV
jgi:hypothetical protein